MKYKPMQEVVPPSFYEKDPKKTKRLKTMDSSLMRLVAAEVKALLHAGRDGMRNRREDTRKISFNCADGYYGEAFGLMRLLVIQGYGYFGSSNLHALTEHPGGAGGGYNNITQPEQNLRWWFAQLERQVLDEEGWKLDGSGDGQCLFCLSRYRKDDSTMRLKEAMNR